MTQQDATITVSAFDIPESQYLSTDTQLSLQRRRDISSQEWKVIEEHYAINENSDLDSIAVKRAQRAEAFYQTSMYKEMFERYPVTCETFYINGVRVEKFIPVSGPTPENNKKILINLHGGGFRDGSCIASRLESIPIAVLSGVTVISIDYRMAPEYQFPAGSEDVETVYRALLESYQPENIGIYGCSAGAMLTAQAIARFIEHKLTLPAAIGMFFMGASSIHDVGSGRSHIGRALSGFDWKDFCKNNAYFNTMTADDFLAYPADCPQLLVKFPPSLLLTATRDFALSSVVKTHSELRRLGVEAELYVWEGLDHVFHYYSDIPESRESYDAIVEFFSRHLK